jgi:hypothetical protein
VLWESCRAYRCYNGEQVKRVETLQRYIYTRLGAVLVGWQVSVGKIMSSLAELFRIYPRSRLHCRLLSFLIRLGKVASAVQSVQYHPCRIVASAKNIRGVGSPQPPIFRYMLGDSEVPRTTISTHPKPDGDVRGPGQTYLASDLQKSFKETVSSDLTVLLTLLTLHLSSSLNNAGRR